MDEKLGIGIIGTGNAVGAHLSALTQEDGVPGRVVGVCDLDTEKARAAAEKFGIETVYPDAAALIASDDVDVVAIVTPPDTHAELAIAALKAGKTVVCEKPMAESLADCDRMIEAAENSTGRLFVVQNRAYTDAMQTAKKLIDEGAIGDLMCIKTEGLSGEELQKRMPSIRTDEHGTMGTDTQHQTYMGPFLADSDITSVNAIASKRPDTDMVAPDATAVGNFSYANGVQHSFINTFERGRLPAAEHNMEIIGTEGKLRSFRTGPQDARIEALQIQRPGSQEWEDVELADARVRSREFAAMWTDYLNAARTDGEPMMTTENGRRSIQIVDKMYESASRNGAPVAVPPRRQRSAQPRKPRAPKNRPTSDPTHRTPDRRRTTARTDKTQPLRPLAERRKTQLRPGKWLIPAPRLVHQVGQVGPVHFDGLDLYDDPSTGRQ